jgi:exopolyphosphatase/guanosine-5'-triphosphate,3'-diphosphate pyrophosphatase
MRVAALDLGSNTFLCLIADVVDGRIERVIADETELVRLAQGVDKTGVLHPEALERAEKAFARYSKLIQQHQVQAVAAAATSAVRDAKNKDEFHKLTQKYQIPVHILSGDQEAEMTFRGAVDPVEWDGTAVTDVGGGSTEIVIGFAGVDMAAPKVVGHSFQIGSVRLAEKLNLFPPFSPDLIQEGWDFCKKLFASYNLPKDHVRSVRAVAGTPTTLAAMDQGISFSVEKIENYVLSSRQLISWAQKLSKMSPTDISEKFGIELKRADVLPAGAIILAAALDYLGHGQCLVSTRGVRYGLAQRLGSGTL